MADVAESGPFAGWRAIAPQLFAILRIVAALVFIQFGTMKLLAFPVGMPPNNAAAPLMSQMGLAGEMAVAYFQGHFPKSFWPVVNLGTPAILYCFYYLYLSAAGPGIWSVDSARRRASS